MKLKSLFESSTPKFATGTPVTFPYAKNTAKSPNMGTEYAQDIEPAGDYITYSDLSDEQKDKFKSENPSWIFGTIHFNNPLVMPNETTGHGGWKTKLSDAYNGLTGKKLSRAIMKAGYDGIITVDKYGPSEIVNLSGIKN